MQLPRVRFTVRTMTIAVAGMALSLAVRNRAMDAYDAFRRRQGP